MIRTILASPAHTPALLERYLAVRLRSMDLAAPLSAADCQLQSIQAACAWRATSNDRA